VLTQQRKQNVSEILAQELFIKALRLTLSAVYERYEKKIFQISLR